MLAKVTVVMALALFVVFLMRRCRASSRHLVLVGAFASLVVLPLGAAILPVWRIEVRSSAFHSFSSPLANEAEGVAGFGRSEQPGQLSPSMEGGERASVGPGAHTPTGVEWPTWLALVWCAGVLCVVATLVLSLWHARRLRQGAVAWPDGTLLATRLGASIGVHRPVSVGLEASLSGPVTVGSWRPAVLLPADAPTWQDDDVTRAVLHEMAHVARRDWIVQVLARTICAVYWFHPLVWRLRRLLELEAERACDDIVLDGRDPASYAEQLVSLAERVSRGPSTSLPMARRRDLVARVRAVLDPTLPRGPAKRSAAIMAVTGVLLLTLSSSMRPVAADVAPATSALPEVRPIESPPPATIVPPPTSPAGSRVAAPASRGVRASAPAPAVPVASIAQANATQTPEAAVPAAGAQANVPSAGGQSAGFVIRPGHDLAWAMERLAVATSVPIGFESNTGTPAVALTEPLSLRGIGVHEGLRLLLGGDRSYGVREINGGILVRPAGADGRPTTTFLDQIAPLAVTDATLLEIALRVRQVYVADRFPLDAIDGRLFPPERQIRWPEPMRRKLTLSGESAAELLTNVLRADCQCTWSVSYPVDPRGGEPIPVLSVRSLVEGALFGLSLRNP